MISHCKKTIWSRGGAKKRAVCARRALSGLIACNGSFPAALRGPVLIIRRRSPWTIKAASAANENNLLFWARKRSWLLWSLARLLTHYLVFGVTFVPIKKNTASQRLFLFTCADPGTCSSATCDILEKSGDFILSSPLLKHRDCT